MYFSIELQDQKYGSLYCPNVHFDTANAAHEYAKKYVEKAPFDYTLRIYTSRDSLIWQESLYPMKKYRRM